MTIPTLADLVQLNKHALRRLERVYRESELEGAQLMDSQGRRVEAKYVGLPSYVEVIDGEANFTAHHRFAPPAREYEWVSWASNREYFRLTRRETELVLGEDYKKSFKPDGMSHLEFVNAMWLANIERPHDANAYLLGQIDHFNSDKSKKPKKTRVYGSYEVISAISRKIPVAYFRIDPQRHQELGLPERELKERLEEQ